MANSSVWLRNAKRRIQLIVEVCIHSPNDIPEGPFNPWVLNDDHSCTNSHGLAAVPTQLLWGPPRLTRVSQVGLLGDAQRDATAAARLNPL